MKIIDKIVSNFLKKFIGGGNYNVGTGRYRSTTTHNQVVEAFSSWSFSCIFKRAKYLAELELETYINEEAKETWVKDLFEDPYPPADLSENELFKQISYSLDVHGNAYLWTPIQGSKPVQIFPLPPARIVIHYNEGDVGTEIVNYEYQRKYDTIMIPAEEVCHIATPSVAHYYHTSLSEGKALFVEALEKVIAADYSMLKYITEYFDNSAIPPLVMTDPKEFGIQESEWNRLKAQFNEAIPANVPKIVLEKGRKIEPMTTGAGETMKTSIVEGSLSTDIRKRVAAVFEIPDALLTSDFNTRSDAGYILQDFYDRVIEINRKNIDQKLTRHFNKFDSNIKIYHKRFEFIDPEFELKRQEMLLNHGVLTANELREEMGLEPVAEIIEEKSLDGKWDIKIKESEAEEKSMMLKLRDYFEELGEEVLQNINNLPIKVKKLKTRTKAEIHDEFNLINIDKWQEKLDEVLSPVLSNLAINTVEAVIAENALDSIITDYTEEISESVTLMMNKNIGAITNLDESLKQKVISVIAGNPTATKGELLEMLYENIGQQFSELKYSKAEQIARTSTTFTQTKMELDVLKDNGIDYVWLSQRDSKVRKSHRKIDGEKPDKAGYFEVGRDRMKHPGGGSLADENVNCRCRLLAQ